MVDTQPANAIDDTMNEDEILEADVKDVGDDEISALSDECRDSVEVKKTSKSNDKIELKPISIKFKNEKTDVETQQPRAPRPNFFGAPRKPRRNRGQRKNNKSNDGDKQVELVKEENSEKIDGMTGDTATSNFPTDRKSTKQQEMQSKIAPSVKTDPKMKPSDPPRPMTKTGAVKVEQVEDKTALQLSLERIKLGARQLVQGGFISNRHNPRLPGFDTSSKRPRSNKNSPENFPKRSRTYAEVTSDDLVLFISDKESEIDETKAGLLEKGMMKELFSLLDTSPRSATTYHSSSTRFGSLRMVCTDRFSAKWFTETILGMRPPWPGAELVIESAGERKRKR